MVTVLTSSLQLSGFIKPLYTCYQQCSVDILSELPLLKHPVMLCLNLTHCSNSLSSVQVVTICKILEGILPKESVRGAPPPDKKLLEYHFVFACVWAFGGCMLVDKVGHASVELPMAQKKCSLERAYPLTFCLRLMGWHRGVL